ncbi:MAG: hypothetical protein M3511_13780 [Deinococcota bacterium]|jgi:cytidylate kinase|nr:hypothetical protein [Deinococcota bacterium]
MPGSKRRTAEVRVLLPPSVKVRLLRHAEREGKSLSGLMVEAAEAYLKKEEHPLAALVGLWADAEDIDADEIIAARTMARELDFDLDPPT